MSDILSIRSASDTRWDCVALGEVMLRFDPGFGRVRTARQFQVWEGGGEYNVARALRKCFGLRTSVVTALPKNELGWLVEDFINQGGVDTSHILWRDFDGIGRNARVGLNFVEKGFGIRPALGCSDRANSAASQLKPGEVDWDALFAEGVRWFHTGGIFAALSPDTAATVLEAVAAARRHGAIVSYDVNYRPSLWNALGDSASMQALSRRIAQQADVLIGHVGDFARCFGIDPGDDDFRRAMPAILKAFPNFKVVATTARDALSAGFNNWSASLYADGRFYDSVRREKLEIYDRIGGGDGFASGLAYAFLAGKGPQAAVDYGAAHGALAMTTPGDTSMASLSEVEAAIAGQGAHVIR